MKNRELHLHLDGSLRVETVWELLQRENIDSSVKSLEQLDNLMRVPSDCQSLVEYLQRFNLPLKVLQSPSAIERVSYELVQDLAKLGMDYSEIRFAPQLSTWNGCSQLEITKAAIRGVNRAEKELKSIKCGLILCLMRGDNNEELNKETISVAEKTLGDTVCAIDIAGAESLFPTRMFLPLLKDAKSKGLPMTIHSGEVDDKQSLEDTLSLGVKRIGHGIYSNKYPDIVSRLIDNDVTLEVCVTSNFQTKSVASIEEHPIRQLFDKGVKIALSSDNSTVSNTNLVKEFEVIKDCLNFTDSEMDKIRQYSKDASFYKL